MVDAQGWGGPWLRSRSNGGLPGARAIAVPRPAGFSSSDGPGGANRSSQGRRGASERVFAIGSEFRGNRVLAPPRRRRVLHRQEKTKSPPARALLHAFSGGGSAALRASDRARASPRRFPPGFQQATDPRSNDVRAAGKIDLTYAARAWSLEHADNEKRASLRGSRAR